MVESPVISAASSGSSGTHARAARSSGLGRARVPAGKRTLMTVLRERGVLSTPHAVDVALHVCDALSIAHENGIVHGQLGLGCVRLSFSAESGPGDVEIFTIAPDADGIGLDVVQVAPFFEPERQHGRPVDALADVYALGALLYAMLIGVSPPFGAGAGGSVEVPPDSMPGSLAAVVEACLATQPGQRPASIDLVAERIASFATWPPDHFARLAAHRDRRARAERARKNLEERGLGDVPNVLDKLDDAAIARASRGTEAITSVLHAKTTEAALERLMTAVHEGTDAARVQLASELPALVDFDDDDDDLVLPTIVQSESSRMPSRAAAGRFPELPYVEQAPCPLSIPPVVLPDPPPALAVAPAAIACADVAHAGAPPRSFTTTFALVAAALAICVVTGFVGYTLSARASAAVADRAPAPARLDALPAPLAAPPPAAPAAPPPAAITALPAPASAEPPAIPVFTPSSLPEVAPVTPASLPEAKR